MSAPSFANQPLSVYTSAPFLSCGNASDVGKLLDTARWSDQAGCAGMLIYTDNRLLDPWVLSQLVLANTERLAPLVAVQPLYMHPFSAAKMVASYARLFERRVALNFVSGGFPFDFASLRDKLDHDQRYLRLAEYAQVLLGLLASDGPFSYQGEFYDVYGLKLDGGPLEPHLQPQVMVSGSSAAGRDCAAKIGAVSVMYPQPHGEELTVEQPTKLGMRVGVLARESTAAAWKEAAERFPDDPSGREMLEVMLSSSESQWHQQLTDPRLSECSPDGVYWLGPFRTYRTFCPYLVGSYAEVGAYLRRYLTSGHETIILDMPHSPDDLTHAALAFEQALTS